MRDGMCRGKEPFRSRIRNHFRKRDFAQGIASVFASVLAFGLLGSSESIVVAITQLTDQSRIIDRLERNPS